MAFITGALFTIRHRHSLKTTNRPNHSIQQRLRPSVLCCLPKTGTTTTTKTTTATAGPQTFRSLYSDRLPEWLLSRLEELTFTTPTPIQAASLPHTLGDNVGDVGTDVVMHAETGSGKTLAYLLPALSSIEINRAATQALVIVPTPELIVQIAHVARALVAVERIPVLALMDDDRRTAQQLRAGAPRLVVGRVETVRALLESGRLRVELVRVLVVDEFDAILGDDDATAALQYLLGSPCRAPPRQTILASATVPQHQHFLRSCVTQRWTRENIIHVALQDRRTPELLRHMYVVCAKGRKLGALKSLLRAVNQSKCIVFVGRSRDAVKIASNMEHLSVVGIDEHLPDVVRREGFTQFRNGDASILIASEVAARGLDVPDVEYVFHLDLPTDADRYLHRAGRCARAGRDGTSVLLVEDGELFVLGRMANALNVEFERVRRPTELVAGGK